MTDKEKAKAYDEAKARMSQAYNSNRCTIGFMNEIFPEFKINEDKKIWKEIYQFVYEQRPEESWIAWLEKQNPVEYSSEDEKIRRDIITYLQVANQTIPQFQMEEWIAWLKKQKEFVSADFDDVWEWADCDELTAPLEKYSKDAIKEMCHAWYDKGIELERKSWLEKQDEQKPADKVEPKFKVGDFIKHNKANLICKVISVNSGSYYVENIMTSGRIELFNAEQNYHLWTIEDAKDGDVLVTNSDIVFLFKFLDEEGTISYYSCCNKNSGAYFPKIKERLCDQDVYPATKEQRDLLFQKMKEAGYEWNEEKELKKIEEEYDGEEYGIDSLFHAQRILEKTLGEVDGYQTDDGILSHKCAISAVKKLYEKKPTWSEEDEAHIDKACEWLEKNFNMPNDFQKHFRKAMKG